MKKFKSRVFSNKLKRKKLYKRAGPYYFNAMADMTTKTRALGISVEEACVAMRELVKMYYHGE